MALFIRYFTHWHELISPRKRRESMLSTRYECDGVCCRNDAVTSYRAYVTHTRTSLKINEILAMYILNYQLSWASFLLKLKWVAICVAITRRISFEHITKRDAFETQHIIFGSNIIPVPYFNHSRACARPISSIVPISWFSNTSAC